MKYQLKKKLFDNNAVIVPDKGEFGAERPGHKHAGVDFVKVEGTKVYALMDGLLQNRMFGKQLEVWISSLNGSEQHVNVHLSKYAHVNGRVKTGELIGYTGDSGTPGSFHLHFERRLISRGIFTPVDPMPYLLGLTEMPGKPADLYGQIVAAGEASIINDAGEYTTSKTAKNDVIPYNRVRSGIEGDIQYGSAFQKNVWISHLNTQKTKDTLSGHIEPEKVIKEQKDLANQIVEL